jgi:hypothetical protein
LDFHNSFAAKIKIALIEYGLNAGDLTEERVFAIFQDVYKIIDLHILKLEGTGVSGRKEVVVERVETDDGYELHLYGGIFHQLPLDWRFPISGVHDLWRHWWLGNTAYNPADVYKMEHVWHAAGVPLPAIEKVNNVVDLVYQTQ